MIFSPTWSRRTFLKASLLATLTLAGGNTVWARDLVEDQLSEGKLFLHNLHTAETLKVTYRDPQGNYDPHALKTINWFLRSPYKDEVHNIDVRTLEILNTVNRKVGNRKAIEVISGYRSPAYNALLREEGRGVAKHSFHMKGQAIDIRIPGVPLRHLHRVALKLRAGGVGYYPHSNFIHLDSGPFRTW
jgi:uncharacterized protein YcbK (DUF882 family)